MTENEAIKIFVTEKHCLDKSTKGICKINCGDCKENIPITYQKEAYEMAISALKEIQQYKLIKDATIGEIAEVLKEFSEIGTVEKCREAMSRYREREKTTRCRECLFLEDRKSGKKGAISGVCRIKPQNGRRYGESRACRFFEKDYENLEG